MQCTILAARSVHEVFAAYHTRLNHARARLTYLCGSPKIPTQFLFCRILLRRNGGRTAGSINQLLPDLIDASEGAISISKLLKNYRIFEEIYSRQGADLPFRLILSGAPRTEGGEGLLDGQS